MTKEDKNNSLFEVKKDIALYKKKGGKVLKNYVNDINHHQITTNNTPINKKKSVNN